MGIAYRIHNQHALYFLTYQVVGWAVVITKPAYKDILMVAMEYRVKQNGLEVMAYVIMTNHMHVNWQRKTKPLSEIVREFKRHTSKSLVNKIASNKESRRKWLLMLFRDFALKNKRSNQLQLWTHENHAVKLSSQKMINQRINYIH